jgi:hypothetical protein
MFVYPHSARKAVRALLERMGFRNPGGNTWVISMGLYLRLLDATLLWTIALGLSSVFSAGGNRNTCGTSSQQPAHPQHYLNGGFAFEEGGDASDGDGGGGSGGGGGFQMAVFWGAFADAVVKSYSSGLIAFLFIVLGCNFVGDTTKSVALLVASAVAMFEMCKTT